MSAPSTTRWLGDRNAAAVAVRPKSGAAQKPTITPTPISASDKNPNKKSLSGKENPRPDSRAQKPAVRSVPLVEKAPVAAAGGGGGGGRTRWSTSSAPRGRSPSPSEFIRVFRDSGVSNSKGGGENRVVSNAGKKNETRVSREIRESCGLGVELGKKIGHFEGNGAKREEREKISIGIRVTNGNCNKDGIFSSNSEKSSEIKNLDSLSLGSSERSCAEAKALENLKENGLSEGGIGNRVGIKYTSKLHEKLAFLEGKVKRIVSDIKSTKEMLDLNNPDASKVILSDIKDKILGMEKGIGTIGDDSSKSGGNDCGEMVVIEKDESKKVDDVKGSVKGLNSNELEVRLFPHHKLLRDRSSMKTSSGSSQNHDESDIVKSSGELKVEEKLLSPVDENPIALEFLASLNKDVMVPVMDKKVDFNSCEFQEMDGAETSERQDSSKMFNDRVEEEIDLIADEAFDEFDDQENRQTVVIGEDAEDACVYQVHEIGSKNSTGGWFVSEGESVLLAHDDGSCSFYDIANCEEKAVYKPPAGVLPNMWRDCWIIQAPSADGCSGRYVVSASAGNTLDSGFCSWDFYNKDVRACHIEDGGTTTSRTVLGPLSNNATYRRNALCSIMSAENRQWWYRPCGPLITSAASSQCVVKIHDIRDGEQILKWEVQKPVLAMDYSSPLQWRNKGKLVVAEAETVSMWDINSLTPQSLLSVSSSGQKISALHVINTDAELGGGVRQRVTSAEAEGNDGVFCTPDSINVLDFRHPTGIGLKIPKIGVSVQSVFARGDSIYVGCSYMRSAGKKQPCSLVQQFSVRKQRLVSSLSLPESNAHLHYSAMTQVWGNLNLVMGVCGLGLFVFDSMDDPVQSYGVDYDCTQKAKEIIGPDDMYSPSFDYLGSRVLIISRDRPAMWRQLP